MNYEQLQKKMGDIYNALDNKNGLMQCNNYEVRVALIECNNEIEKIVSLFEEKSEIEKERKLNVAEINRAQEHQNFIFNSGYKFEKKIEELAEASKITAEYAQILKEQNVQLKNIEAEIKNCDGENKMQLIPYWNEMIEKFDIYAIISPKISQNEIQPHASTTLEEQMEAQVKNDEENDGLNQLINSFTADEIFAEIKPKKKKIFGVFNKKKLNVNKC